MDNSRFNILDAAKNAYLFAGREWPHLLRAGVLPAAMQIGTAIFLQFQRPDAGLLETYLWEMPTTLLFAWFVFLTARLLLLGERIDRLPPDTDYLRDRQQAMKLSVIVSLLFNMAVTAALMVLMAAGSDKSLPPALTGVMTLLLVGMLFWGVRLGTLPILAAVQYPFRDFLQKTHGLMFSLRLIGLGMVCLFPLAMLFQMFLAIIITKPVDPSVPLQLTDMQQIALSVAAAPLSLAVSVIMNAAAAYALKQVLGAKQNGVAA